MQCLYWCAKEAVFKLVANEGVEFKQQINILPFNPELKNHFLVRFISGSKDSILQLQLYFQTFSEHCLVWVTDDPINLNMLK